MKLPPISSSPLWIPDNTPPVQPRRCMMVTPITLPLISDSARLPMSNQSIPRLNPLRPPLGLKRTVSLETQNAHDHNHERTLILQRRQHFRCHEVWRNPFYGTASEREEYRKELREHLKRQMAEKCAELKTHLTNKEKEADYMREVDLRDLSRDAERMIQHRKAMTVFRDENKRLMEERWRDLALRRSQEAFRERGLLCLNPINWSGTLK